MKGLPHSTQHLDCMVAVVFLVAQGCDGGGQDPLSVILTSEMNPINSHHSSGILLKVSP